MRVLSGKFKGKNLFAGRDLSIRPITNRLKDIVFSILQDFVVEKKILDLFSGSGSLGIEALSRGANHVTFVEKEESSIKVLKQNITNLNIDQELVKFVKSDVLTFLSQNKDRFHLVFSDPPFKYPFLQQMTDQVLESNLLEKNGLLILHHEIDNPLLKYDVPYTMIKQKKIGRSLLSFIMKEADNV
jgi:16S rRNA (guanine(966)-N(2))-methyltransferase RsmD